MGISDIVEKPYSEQSSFRNEDRKVHRFDLRVQFYNQYALKDATELFPKRADAQPFPVAEYFFSGIRIFSVYLSNSSKGSNQESVTLVFATDCDVKSNREVVELLDGKTLMLQGTRTPLGFNIEKIRAVHALVGSYNNRSIRADISFHEKYGIGARGFPEDLYNQLMLLPDVFAETTSITNRIAHWDEYLKINEKVALDTQTVLCYSQYCQCNNAMQLVFWITEGKIETKHLNSSIKLILSEEIEDDRTKYEGPMIGTVNQFNAVSGELTIDLDIEYYDIWSRNKAELPATAKLFITKYGDIVQIKRLRNGLMTLARGQATNPYLDVFLFDSTKARLADNKVNAIRATELLQTNLNTEQMRAVEGAISSQDLFLIQGPPGTGKTTVIAEICFQNAIRNRKTLIASQTNLAVDNALSKLVHHPMIRALRKGNERSVQEEGISFIEGNVIQTWLMKTTEDCKKKIARGERILTELKNLEMGLPRVIEAVHSYTEAQKRTGDNMKQRADHENKISQIQSLLAWMRERHASISNGPRRNAYMQTLNEDFRFGPKYLEDATTIIRENNRRVDERTQIERTLTDINSRLSSFKTLSREMHEKLYGIRKIRKMLDEVPSYDSPSYPTMKEWQTECTSLSRRMKEALIRRPNFLAFLFGFASNWIAESYRTYIKSLTFSRMTNDIIHAKQEQGHQMDVQNPLPGMIADLESVYVGQVSKWKDEIEDRLTNVAALNQKIQRDASLQMESKEFVDRFNATIPKPTASLNFETLLNAQNIEQYYRDSWHTLKVDTESDVSFMKQWINRLEEKNEQDALSLKQLYISNANVIGITCSQSGSRDFTTQYPTFDIVVIDEVSKATPPELILPILKAKCIVLVGDHKQLPPMIGMETYEEVSRQFGISDEETNHMKNSLFEELYLHALPQTRVMLTTQYRMHPQIMEVINQFYSDQAERGLVCGIPDSDTVRAHDCHGKAIRRENHVLWVDIPLVDDCAESRSKKNQSYSNDAEFRAIKDILLTISSNLLANDYSGTKKVGIISFYSNQVRVLERELLEEGFQARIQNLALRIGSVDRFQGIECPIVICSFVRNNIHGEIGFAKDPRRINVALSRAQELSIVVGCSELFCWTNRNHAASVIYNAVVSTISHAGGIRNAIDFR